MSRWFRHYAGLVRDDKLVRAAVHAKQPVERVVWVFGAILESAAEINNSGAYDLDVGEAARFLGCEETDITTILETLTSLSRLGDGRVTRWQRRQFKSDTSALRQRRYRARQRENKKSENSSGNNGDVTPSRNVTVTPQRQSTEKKKDSDLSSQEKKDLSPPATGPLEFSKEGSPEDHFWELLPQLHRRGIARSRCLQLLKLSDSDFEVALVTLRQVATAREPSSYLGKIIANLKTEQAPVTIAIGGDADEPEWVREWRAEGYTVERRSNGTRKIADMIFDETGRQLW